MTQKMEEMNYFLDLDLQKLPNSMANITCENYDSIYDLCNGFDCLVGTNTSYLNKQIDMITSKDELTPDDQSSLYKMRCELGQLKTGMKKPRVCWHYVRNGSCYHTHNSSLEMGEVMGGLWHPDKNEKAYLLKKQK